LSWKRSFQTLVYTAIVILLVGSLLGILLTGPVVVRFPHLVVDVDPSSRKLRETVELLCAEFAPRDHTRTDNLDRAAAWIGGRMREAGLEVEDQEYTLPTGSYRRPSATSSRCAPNSTRSVSSLPPWRCASKRDRPT